MENGITVALKPKLKFDTRGFGCSNEDFPWWDNEYNKDLKNIFLDKKSDNISINVNKGNAINTSSYKSEIKKKKILYYRKFLKSSTLHDGNMINYSSEFSKDDMRNKPIIVQMSDDDLLKACEGRTGHKAARHGLTLNGKLTRIAKQEKQFMDINNDEKITTIY
jgi:hypothetical protein